MTFSFLVSRIRPQSCPVSSRCSWWRGRTHLGMLGYTHHRAGPLPRRLLPECAILPHSHTALGHQNPPAITYSVNVMLMLGANFWGEHLELFPALTHGNELAQISQVVPAILSWHCTNSFLPNVWPMIMTGNGLVLNQIISHFSPGVGQTLIV